MRPYVPSALLMKAHPPAARTTAPDRTVQFAPSRPTPEAPVDIAIRSQQEMQRRTVIQQPNPKLQEPTAENLHVIGTAESAAIDDASVVASKGVTPFSQPAELHMCLVDHALDPIDLCKPETSREPTLDDRGARRSRRRHIDDGGVGRSGRAARPDTSLVDEDNARASLGRRDRGPTPSGTAADDKNVGGQGEAAGLVSRSHLAPCR